MTDEQIAVKHALIFTDADMEGYLRGVSKKEVLAALAAARAEQHAECVRLLREYEDVDCKFEGLSHDWLESHKP